MARCTRVRGGSPPVMWPNISLRNGPAKALWCMLCASKEVVRMTGYLSAVGARALMASLLLSSALVGTTFAQTTLSTPLSGPGNGNGQADVTFNPGAGTVCYNLLLNLQPPATAAHIHRGAAGANGPIVVPF